MFKQNKGSHTHDSLEDQPLLVMMLLQRGACYRVMDCISITGCDATCLTQPVAWLFSIFFRLCYQLFYRWMDNDHGISSEKRAQSHSFPSGECAGGWKQECDRLQNGPRVQDRWREEAPFGCINLWSSLTVTLCCTRPASSVTAIIWPRNALQALHPPLAFIKAAKSE